MKSYYLIPILPMIAAACTFTPQDNGVNAEIHPPLMNHSWHVEHYNLQNGTKVCSISSGYNGVDVILRHRPEGEDMSIKSNRRMEPGATLTVNVAGGTFETYDMVFPKEMARTLVEDFAKGGGGKAYLEWSEVNGPEGGQRINIQNIVQLDNFGTQLKECRDWLNL